VASLLGLAAARTEGSTTLVDVAGDLPAVLALGQAERIGLRQWLSAGDEVPSSGLRRLMMPVTSGLQLLPAGPLGSSPISGSGVAAQIARLAAEFEDVNVVVDAGVVRRRGDVADMFATRATQSLLVLRPCYLAIQRAAALEVAPDGIVLVEESGRSLDGRDVEAVIGAPVLAKLAWDASIARAVDAGRLVGKPLRAARAIDELSATLMSSEGLRRAG
jgi:hypothetical protein